jgi:chromate transport protein ChrA
VSTQARKARNERENAAERWQSGKGAIAGIMAAFVGLLVAVVLSMGRQVLTVPAALVLAVGAFAAVRAFKLSPPIVFGAGLAVWAAYLALGGVA